jgi:hypothetical protein
MPVPRDVGERLEKMVNAWDTLAPSKSFGGMTRQQFEEACFPSKEMRGLVETLQTQLAQAIDQRDAADKATTAKMQLVVNGVLADPTEGPDSALYQAFGYTRKSERRSGLTRKDNAPPEE